MQVSKYVIMQPCECATIWVCNNQLFPHLWAPYCACMYVVSKNEESLFAMLNLFMIHPVPVSNEFVRVHVKKLTNTILWYWKYKRPKITPQKAGHDIWFVETIAEPSLYAVEKLFECSCCKVVKIYPRIFITCQECSPLRAA